MSSGGIFFNHGGFVFALLYHKYFFAGGMLSSAWCGTHQQNLNGSFSPLLTWEGEGFVQWRVLGIAEIKMMMGVLGCRCTESRGGDLGHGGDRREKPAICLGPWAGDPASLFSLTGYTGVTGRARPPGWRPEWGVWALWTLTIKRMKM